MVHTIDIVHALYNTMLHPWFHLVGVSELTVRLPSLVAVGVATAAFAIRTSRRYRLTAPCVDARASTMRAIASSTSTSVNVRSADRNVRRSERLTRPSGTPLPR